MRSSSVRLIAFAVATVALVAPSAAWARGYAADATASAQLPAVRLVKIQYDPPGDDDLSNSSLNREWVAIHNFGTKPAKLTGWVLRDVSGYRYTFTDGFTLAPDATVTVHTGTGSDRTLHVYWDQGSYIWNNTGDKAMLKNAAGTVVDTCAYAGDGAWVSC
jgi:hypothetical protein